MVKRHGVMMLQHLLNFRKEELGSTKVADLTKVLESLEHLDLEGATDTYNDPVGRPANPKENNNHRRSLFALDTKDHRRSLAAIKIDNLIREQNLSPKSPFSLGSSDGSRTIMNEMLRSSSSEDDDRIHLLIIKMTSSKNFLSLLTKK